MPPPASPLLKPSPALQVGVTGHRPGKLEDAAAPELRGQLQVILRALARAYHAFAATDNALAAFAEGAPLPPRLLSPLAEGADSWAAEVALDEGYALHAPLPFSQALYRADFQHDPAALVRFESLLARAERVLEWDGKVDSDERKRQAYRRVGQFVVAQADVLLALWNGVEDGQSPGTAGTVAFALQEDVPVIRINSQAPFAITLYDPRARELGWQSWDEGTLAGFLSSALLPLPASPSAQKHGMDTDKESLRHRQPPENFSASYYQHEPPRRNWLGGVYQLWFTGLSQLKVKRGYPYRESPLRQWQECLAFELQAHPGLQAHFIHADSLANYYADRYRGTFLVSLLLGSLAVLFALLGAPLPGSPLHGLTHGGSLFAGLELATMLVIAYLVIVRQRFQDMHGRWLTFRLMAERIRQSMLLAPCGEILETGLPVFHALTADIHEWSNWLLLRLQRAEGMLAGRIDAEYWQRYRAYLQRILQDQSAYHIANAQRNAQVAHILHHLNIVLLTGIIIGCILHIFWHAEAVAFYSTLVAAVLPACGAALAGILSYGEFERIAHRSNTMAAHLQSLTVELNKESSNSLDKLKPFAVQVIDLMNLELADWHIIFRAKSLEMHA